MKKGMNKTIESNITEESINIVNNIISNMEGKSFHNHYHILYDICNLIEKTNIIYLEIGAFAGGSASLVSTNKNVSKVFSVDIGTPINKEIAIGNVTKFKHDSCEYEYIQGNSSHIDIINKVRNTIFEIDILFIDGDHGYNAVINDFKNYKDLVSKGGYIIFDDYLDKFHSPDVFIAVNDIIETQLNNEFEIIGSIKYDLIKKTNFPTLSSSNEFILKKIK